MDKVPKVEKVEIHISNTLSLSLWQHLKWYFGVAVLSYKIIIWLWSPFMNQNALSLFQVGLLFYLKIRRYKD